MVTVKRRKTQRELAAVEPDDFHTTRLLLRRDGKAVNIIEVPDPRIMMVESYRRLDTEFTVEPVAAPVHQRARSDRKPKRKDSLAALQVVLEHKGRKRIVAFDDPRKAFCERINAVSGMQAYPIGPAAKTA